MEIKKFRHSRNVSRLCKVGIKWNKKTYDRQSDERNLKGDEIDGKISCFECEIKQNGRV